MRREGGLLEQIASHDNLRRAFWRAARGKQDTQQVRSFSRRLDEELGQLGEEISAGQVQLGRSHTFRIRDPKPRLIHAPPFRDRVLHHALMNCCEPVFERGLIDDTYACRTGRGRLAAIRRAEHYMAKHRWFLKLDIRSYFDSIDHSILFNRICGKFKEERLLDIFFQIIDAHHRPHNKGLPHTRVEAASRRFRSNKGLPIGALTSQHFANDFLSPVDRFIKEVIRAPGYVRYMDDMVLWADDRETLHVGLARLMEIVGEKLNLAFKDFPYLNRTEHGVNLLGYRLWPGRTALRVEAVRRIRRRVRGCHRAWMRGEISGFQLQEKLEAWTAFVDGTGNTGERARVFRERFWARAERGEPGDSRRELEQRREERAVRVPQRQPPVERELESGLSPLPSSGSSLDDPGLTRRVSSPLCPLDTAAKAAAPTGVGRGTDVPAKTPVGGFPTLNDKPLTQLQWNF